MKQTLLLVVVLFCAFAVADDYLVKVGWDGTFKYNPDTLQIKPGDTVVWAWPPTGSLIHTVTAGETSSCYPSGVFDSLGKIRGNFTHLFPSVGTFGYYCAPHCSVGMVGTIIVSGAPVTTTLPPVTEPPTPAPTALPKSFLALAITFSACPSAAAIETYISGLAAGANLNRSSIVIVNDPSCDKNGKVVVSPLVITTVQPGTFSLNTDLLPAIEILVDNGQVAPPPGQQVPIGEMVQFRAGAAAISATMLLVFFLAALLSLYQA